MLPLAIAVLVTLALAAALLLLMRKASRNARNLPVTPEWILELDPERYRPMARLLDQRDIEFLRSQPGYSFKAATKMRQHRALIFRGYLNTLNDDFQRVCSAIRVLMSQSKNDRPDLAMTLLRQQAVFAAYRVYAEFRVILYLHGFAGMDASVLVNCFDVVRLELRTLAPAGMGATA